MLSGKRVARRNVEFFVGLRNGSATCYMNAVFQQLFMQPAVRAQILSTPEVPRKEQKESVFYQLQVRPTCTAAQRLLRLRQMCGSAAYSLRAL